MNFCNNGIQTTCTHPPWPAAGVVFVMTCDLPSLESRSTLYSRGLSNSLLTGGSWKQIIKHDLINSFSLNITLNTKKLHCMYICTNYIVKIHDSYTFELSSAITKPTLSWKICLQPSLFSFILVAFS